MIINIENFKKYLRFKVLAGRHSKTRILMERNRNWNLTPKDMGFKINFKILKIVTKKSGVSPLYFPNI